MAPLACSFYTRGCSATFAESSVLHCLISRIILLVSMMLLAGMMPRCWPSHSCREGSTSAAVERPSGILAHHCCCFERWSPVHMTHWRDTQPANLGRNPANQTPRVAAGILDCAHDAWPSSRELVPESSTGSSCGATCVLTHPAAAGPCWPTPHLQLCLAPRSVPAFIFMQRSGPVLSQGIQLCLAPRSVPAVIFWQCCSPVLSHHVSSKWSPFTALDVC